MTTEAKQIEYCLFHVQTWCLPSSEWASWAQAFVSAMAVVIGALAIWWQVNRQQKLEVNREAEQVRQKVRDVLFVISAATDLLNEGIQQASTYDGYDKFLRSGSTSSQLELITRGLADVSSKDLPNAQVRIAFIAAELAIKTAFDVIRVAKKENYPGRYIAGINLGFQKALESNCKTVDAAKISIQSALPTRA